MCECVSRVNVLLADRNTILVQDMLSTTPHSFVATAKLRSSNRVKPCTMMATFCPFCGAKYPERRSIFDKGNRDEAQLPLEL